MNEPLSVYFCSPAPVARAHWLQTLLQPVIKAAKLPNIPLEIRPVGIFSGYCDNPKFAKDGRVSLSSKLVFWSKDQIIHLYLHECSHRILNDFAVQDHGAVFFSLNSILRARCSEFFDFDVATEMSFYDFQDQPPELFQVANWRSQVLDFAIETIALFEPDQCPAAELPAKIEAAWESWLIRRRARLNADAETARKAKLVDVLRAELAVSMRKNSIHFWFLTFLSFASFLILVGFVAREFTR